MFTEAGEHISCHNVFVERVWRSAKYERIYLKAYDAVASARADIAEYLQHRATAFKFGANNP